MAMELSETATLSESDSTSDTSTRLMSFDPPLNDEMAMSNEDFDHLLYGNPISSTMKQSFSPDSGFCDDQTIMSTDTEFDSIPTSPISLNQYFSQSPSSESGIEEDEDDDHKIESLEANQPLTRLYNSETQDPLSTSLVNQQNTEAVPNVSTVADAVEELKQLLYTVASHVSSLPTIPTTTNTMSVSSTTILPSCNQLINTPLMTIPTTSQSGTAAACTTSLGGHNQVVTPTLKVNTYSKCVRRSRKAREKPKLVILDEPEENYRARYESEGCRGPIHGTSENSYPTIKVSGYSEPIWITVYLVTSSGLPHYHSIHGPGSTKVPCKEIILPGGIPAVQLMVDPDSKMTAIMDSLSIRRLRNWEGDKELKKRGIDPRTWKRERKEGRLLFQAEIVGEDGQSNIKLTCKSRIFQCSSSGPTGNPEIWWTSRTEGSVEGKEEMGLIGKKFPTDLKARFYADLPSGKSWESYAEVNKNKSHQGAAVILTPPYSDQDILFPVTVNIELISGNAKNPKCSEPIEFTYKPRQDIMIASVTPSGHSLGGILAGLQGGLTSTTAQSLSSLVTMGIPTPTVIPIQPAMTTSCMTITPVVPDLSKKEPDVNDWQRLCVQIKELQQTGHLNACQIKDLCIFIERRDLLLLQAFRSANNAGTREECRTKFRQYLMGLVGNV